MHFENKKIILKDLYKLVIKYEVVLPKIWL